MSQEYYFEYLKKTDRFPQSVYHRVKHSMVRSVFNSLRHGSLVLDAGCGVGNITGKYCSDYSIVGIDEQLPAVRYASEFHAGKYIQGILYDIPFPDNTFDAIFFLDAIEHCVNPVRVLRELSRVLKPRSEILICTMNYASPLWYILGHTWHRLFGGSCQPYLREVHPIRYTAEILRQHCQGLLEEVYLKKRIMNMELFYLGKKS